MTKKVPSIDYYGNISGLSEPDMRQEMINTLEGRYPEVAKGKSVLLRKFRRDDNGDLILCSCVSNVTGEPDKDSYCPISMGERYLWDESEITVYKVLSGGDGGLATADTLVEPGLLNVPLVVFYMRYDVAISEDDKIVEIVLNNEGVTQTPIQRTAIYKIQTLVEYRGDRGRVEYYKAACSKERQKYLSPPSFGDL